MKSPRGGEQTLDANLQGEKRYEQVYGATFARYTQQEMIEFIEPFKVRFGRNKLDARSIFEGKKCFDAGCGNGRGALFMLMNGAAHVTACDFSSQNVESTRSFLRQFGFENAEVFESSLESIPRPDETFDFVWCNGVIMHTRYPNRCLNEIARILKVGGKSWIYVYGSGGLYWRTIYRFRRMLHDVAVADCMAALQLMRYETRYVAEFIDDWFATYLRSYTHKDLSAALEAAGFAPAEPLPFGMAYDTSHRRNSYGLLEKDLMGEGDLRYLLHKTKQTPVRSQQILSDGEYGSDFEWPPIIAQRMDPAFERFAAALATDWQRIAAAAHLQRELRLQMTKPEPFDVEAYFQTMDRVASYAANCGGL
jgi:ubiquinone/menaquinone biosynthesis C-methylase UbiE